MFRWVADETARKSLAETAFFALFWSSLVALAAWRSLCWVSRFAWGRLLGVGGGVAHVVAQFVSVSFHFRFTEKKAAG
jgi:hypothetical protein